MATQYPSDFPRPTIAGFGISVASGVVRSNLPGQQQQRRVFKTMPHTFALRFVVSITQWWQWQKWVTANGYNWFAIELPSMYAGIKASCGSLVIVRFITDIQASAMTRDHFEITVSAESSPSMPATILQPSGNYIIANTPVAPASPDVIIAETGAGISPSANDISAGSPGLTAA